MSKKKIERMRKVLWTDDDYMVLWDDGTLGLSDGVGYIDTLSIEDTKKLYKALRKFFRKQT